MLLGLSCLLRQLPDLNEIIFRPPLHITATHGAKLRIRTGQNCAAPNAGKDRFCRPTLLYLRFGC